MELLFDVGITIVIVILIYNGFSFQNLILLINKSSNTTLY